MMNELWKNLLIVVISAILTFIIQNHYYTDQLEIKKLDVHTEFDVNYFSKPKFPRSKIEFRVDGQDKEKLGKLSISLFNYSPENYLDLPINIKLTPANVSDFKIVTYSAVGEKGLPDLASEIGTMKFDGSSYHFSYKVTSINRVEKSDYGMQLRILFEGTSEPQVDVVAKGVGTRKFDADNSPYQKDIKWSEGWIAIGIFILFIIGMFLVTGLILSPVISLLTRKWDEKNAQRYAQEIFDAIKSENLQLNISDNELKQYIARILYKRQLTWWNKKSALGKWSLGFIAPHPDDYLL